MADSQISNDANKNPNEFLHFYSLLHFPSVKKVEFYQLDMIHGLNSL